MQIGTVCSSVCNILLNFLYMAHVRLYQMADDHRFYNMRCSLQTKRLRACQTNLYVCDAQLHSRIRDGQLLKSLGLRVNKRTIFRLISTDGYRITWLFAFFWKWLVTSLLWDIGDWRTPTEDRESKPTQAMESSTHVADTADFSCLFQMQFTLYQLIFRLTCFVPRKIEITIYWFVLQVIIGESLLFLRDIDNCDNKTNDRRKRQVFVDAVESCDLFVRSAYITLYESTADDEFTSESIASNELNADKIHEVHHEDQNGCHVTESRVWSFRNSVRAMPRVNQSTTRDWQLASSVPQSHAGCISDALIVDWRSEPNQIENNHIQQLHVRNWMLTRHHKIVCFL
jgi:hypothetical protein